MKLKSIFAPLIRRLRQRLGLRPLRPIKRLPKPPEHPDIVEARSNSRQVERQRCMDEAVNAASDEDAAFTIILYNRFYRVLGPPPHAKEIDVHVVLRDRGRDTDLEGPILLARRLYENSHLYERTRYETIDAASRVQIIRNDHPGFSEESYTRALNFGSWIMR